MDSKSSEQQTNSHPTLSRRGFIFSATAGTAGLFAAGFGGMVESPRKRPNILWITSEDNGIAWVSCYGGKNCRTPVIDKLAGEGFRYTHCFDNAAVCAPTRSTWITGMHAISNGTQPMRSRNDVPHGTIKYYPDILRKAGYHCSNPGKTDYNIGGRPDRSCWDRTKKRDPYGWRYRQAGQPFFAVVNISTSHESRAHGDVEKTRNDPAKMHLFSYHPDLPLIRKNYAKYADAVEKMDQHVGRALAVLAADGLAEETIVIYNSDHGGVMPRSKRFLYGSGTHCPLIVRIPEKFKHLWPAKQPGMTVDRLVSFVDMPKTWLSLAGAPIPDTFHGKIFLGPGKQEQREHHFGWRGRADERCDCVRMIRDKRYAYYKNYMPYAPAGQHLSYLWRAPAAPAWEEHHRQGKTNAITGRFFRPRVSEEFYDTVRDFENVHNLIKKPEQQARIAELRLALRRLQLKHFDSGLLPETMRLARAKKHKVTIYEMVRNPKLYPLASYLDAADLALARDQKNLPALSRALTDGDGGIRYWAIVGLLLLDKHASPAVELITRALEDRVVEVQILAAWTMVRVGKEELGLGTLGRLLNRGSGDDRLLHNVLDWLGKPGLPLVREYLSAKPERRKQFLTLARIAEVNGF